MEGDGCVDDRGHFLVCCCVSNSKGKTKKDFLASILEDPKCSCILTSCPYGTFRLYWNQLPDANGMEREAQMILEPDNTDLESLPVFRALAPRGLKNFTKNPLGVAEMRSFPDKIQEYIPNECRMIEHMTMKSGRCGIVGMGLREEVSDSHIMSVTNHKSSMSLKSYKKENKMGRMVMAKAIQNQLQKKGYVNKKFILFLQKYRLKYLVNFFNNNIS
jgi:hypothetical protein